MHMSVKFGNRVESYSIINVIIFVISAKISNLAWDDTGLKPANDGLDISKRYPVANGTHLIEGETKTAAFSFKS